jgi:hypothetical protein
MVLVQVGAYVDISKASFIRRKNANLTVRLYEARKQLVNVHVGTNLNEERRNKVRGV